MEEERSDLGELAAAAQRALGSDAVVIARTEVERAPTGERLLAVAGVDGLTGRNLDDLRRGLTHLDSALDFGDREWIGIPFLAGTRIAGANIVLSHGFASVLVAPVVVEGRRLGAVYAFKREPRSFAREGLVATFARQAAIAMDQDRSRLHLEVRGQSLAALDELVLAAHNFAELCRAIEKAVTPLFDAEKTGIMVWDERREVLQMVGGSFGASEEVALSCQIPVLDPHSNSARVFTTGRAYYTNDARNDPGIMQEYVNAFGIEKLLSTPLTLAGRPIGVLHIANPGTDFGVEDLDRAEGLTARIAGAVELARTLFRLRRQQRLEEILSQVAVAVASGESVTDFLNPALKGVGRAVEASFLAMVPTEGEPAIWRHGASPLEDVVLEEVRRKPGMRAYVVGPQKAGDPGWAVFYAPVHLGRQRVGTLAALRTRGEPFARDERRAIVRLANLAALSFATERYQQQRAELARLQERQRIADDLHDDVAQILFAAQLNLDAILEREPAESTIAAGVERALGLLVRGDTEIRKVIHRLSNPASPDFDQRLAAAIVGVEQEFSVAIHTQFSDAAIAVANRLRKPPADALIKAAREALVNAAKHAGPCRVSVQLSLTDRERLLLTVMDDGVGAPRSNSEPGHGLASLRRTLDEHGGCLRVGRAPAGGTKVTASIPIPASDPVSAEDPVPTVKV
ncbi:MAG TPA: GAF domain-containing protein [Solirubrobacterales bacterium]|nr:GAF domain-containing protein [Solirubrobacterales bacterium]